MALNTKKAFLYDTTALISASMHKLDFNYLEISPVFIEYKTKSSPEWLDLLDIIHENLDIPATLSDEVSAEFARFSREQGFLVDLKVIQEEFPERIDFLRKLSRDQFDNIEILESDNKMFRKTCKNVKRANRNEPAGVQIDNFNNAFRGKEFGDKAIKRIVSEHKDTDFFIVTSDRDLGIQLEDMRNAFPMNFAGFYTSLRDHGVLKDIGFEKDIPNGNSFNDKLIDSICTKNIESGRKEYDEIRQENSRIVNSSEKFNRFLLLQGKEKVKGLSPTFIRNYSGGKEGGISSF